METMLPLTAIALRNAAAQITQTRSVDQSARTRNEELELRLERANLVLQTLLMILLEKQIIHEDEFREWMLYVDDLDGARDGRVREDNTPQNCPSCGRNSPHSAVKCVYCGEGFQVEFLARRTPKNPNP
jgi:hypothetical protein